MSQNKDIFINLEPSFQKSEKYYLFQLKSVKEKLI